MDINNINSSTVACFCHDTSKMIAEKELRDTVYNNLLTKSGVVSRNPNLDGFIAEELHVASFNQNAIGSGWHAKVLKPSIGQVYGKNSVDIILNNGSQTMRYQVKCGKTAKDTIRMIKEGNYTTQRLLVPAEQVDEVQKAFPNKTVTSQLQTPDGKIVSKPLTKSELKAWQNQVQNGTYETITNLNIMKDAFKQAGKAGAISAVIGVTTETIARYKDFKSGKITKKEYLTEIAKSGGDAGITAAGTSLIMMPIQAAIGAASPVLIPITFAVGSVVSKIVDTIFGRGEYKRILGEAKYYKNLIDYEAGMANVLRQSAHDLERFSVEMQNQQKNFQTINNAIVYYNNENQKKLTELDDLIARI